MYTIIYVSIHYIYTDVVDNHYHCSVRIYYITSSSIHHHHRHI